ncbi:MAG: methionyl-tRNA formyltransferase, partial [Chitinophagaceae bacterium]
RVLVDTVKGLADGSLTEKPQLNNDTPGELKHAPKIFTETCQLNFNQPVEKTYNLVRGLSPYPGAFSFLNNKKLKIFKAEKMQQAHHHTPGQVISDGKTYLRFACADGYLSITDLQLEGKKRMLVGDFLRGYRFE